MVGGQAALCANMFRGRLSGRCYFQILSQKGTDQGIATEQPAKRILGRVQDNGLLRIREMLPDGRVSGKLTGSLVKDSLSGTWGMPPKIIE